MQLAVVVVVVRGGCGGGRGAAVVVTASAVMMIGVMGLVMRTLIRMDRWYFSHLNLDVRLRQLLNRQLGCLRRMKFHETIAWLGGNSGVLRGCQVVQMLPRAHGSR